LLSLPRIIRDIHACLKGEINVCRFLFGEPEGNRKLERHRPRYENIIKILGRIIRCGQRNEASVKIKWGKFLD
jgi:hypothetical protein